MTWIIVVLVLVGIWWLLSSLGAVTRNLIAYTYTASNAGGQVTCGIASLANGSARESAIVDNTTNLYLDYLVSLSFTIASGSPTTSGPYVNIYVNGSNDGTLWPKIQKSDGSTYATGGGDSSVGALGVPSNLRLIGSFGLQTTTSSGERSFTTEPFSVAAAFGNQVPPKFSIIIENLTGVAFSSSATATGVNYLEQNGVWTTSGN